MIAIPIEARQEVIVQARWTSPAVRPLDDTGRSSGLDVRPGRDTTQPMCRGLNEPRESCILFATADVGCVVQIHSAVHSDTKFGTRGACNSSARQLLTGALVNRCRTVARLGVVEAMCSIYDEVKGFGPRPWCKPHRCACPSTAARLSRELCALCAVTLNQGLVPNNHELIP